MPRLALESAVACVAATFRSPAFAFDSAVAFVAAASLFRRAAFAFEFAVACAAATVARAVRARFSVGVFIFESVVACVAPTFRSAGFLLTLLFAVAASAFLSGCSAAPTQASAEAHPLPPLQYMSAWGTKGSNPGQLDEPSGIATDLQGNVYIADAGSQFIHKFQAGGTPLLSFQDDRLKHPQKIAVDRGGAIYVSDPVRASVFVFMPDGDRYREIRVQARPNVENTLDVAIADDGSVSILDTTSLKLFAFNPYFHLQHVAYPATDASGVSRPSSIVSGPADAIYVGGPRSNSLLRYYDGKLAGQIQLTGQPSADKLSDEFALSQNAIFVADVDGHTIHVWSLDGKPRLDLDIAPELGEGQHFPAPLAVSPAGDLLVLDAPHSRVFRYHLNL